MPWGSECGIFRNRKGYFSINVQAVCGPNLVIQNIVARWPGSVHDARMFDNSRLCAQFERGDIDGMLLGDSGYPCRQNLMTPLADPQTQPERRYNVAQIRTRNTVERMFGVWKRMFPCLSTCLRTKLETTLTIIVASAVEMIPFLNRPISRLLRMSYLLCMLVNDVWEMLFAKL